jgi:hypothetical protein
MAGDTLTLSFLNQQEVIAFQSQLELISSRANHDITSLQQRQFTAQHHFDFSHGVLINAQQDYNTALATHHRISICRGALQHAMQVVDQARKELAEAQLLTATDMLMYEEVDNCFEKVGIAWNVSRTRRGRPPARVMHKIRRDFFEWLESKRRFFGEALNSWADVKIPQEGYMNEI